jgi:hypothetical protein
LALAGDAGAFSALGGEDRLSGERWQDGGLASIPEADLPAGSPPWWTSLHAWAQRTGPRRS